MSAQNLSRELSFIHVLSLKKYSFDDSKDGRLVDNFLSNPINELSKQLTFQELHAARKCFEEEEQKQRKAEIEAEHAQDEINKIRKSIIESFEREDLQTVYNLQKKIGELLPKTFILPKS